ncbi:hypothetical protein BCT60_15005 [Vibrio breoganii]|nr:hypothetical protein BCU74_02815 [Vibrio breoganii]PMK56645.1 hypothetical protein BCT98_09615 [Vibrio breoganii]PMM12704.1 hypothetical protein BCT60_15005 [Vibrio breoganii]
MDIVWVVRREDNHGVPAAIKTVILGTYDYYYYLASSKIIVENTIGLQRSPYRKKLHQVLYQTWHGSLGIKRLDGPIVNGRKWKLRRWLASNETNYCLSNSDFETDVYKSSYWPGVKSLVFGHARNDLFFPQNEEKVNPRINTLREHLGLEGKKTLLFAPSHYDGESNPLLDYNFSEITECLSKRFGGSWVVLFRLHPRYISSEFEAIIKDRKDIINVTSIYDMQELLLIADVGITDFSSWIFDFLLTSKPGFILHQDKEFVSYKRGLYFPFESTPFPISSSVDELLDNIQSFNRDDYQEKTNLFLKDKGCIDDGEASRRIVKHIINEIDNG